MTLIVTLALACCVILYLPGCPNDLDQKGYSRSRAEALLRKVAAKASPDEVRRWALSEIDQSHGQNRALRYESLPLFIKAMSDNHPAICGVRGDTNPPSITVAWFGGGVLRGIKVGDEDYRPDDWKRMVQWRPGIYFFHVATH